MLLVPSKPITQNRYPRLKPGFYGYAALRAITAPVGADLNPFVLGIPHIS